MANEFIFIPSVSASAEPLVGRNRNVVSRGLCRRSCDQQAVSGGSGTVESSEAVNKLPVVPGSPASSWQTVDIGFLPTTNMSPWFSRGADVIGSVDFCRVPPAIGSAQQPDPTCFRRRRCVVMNPTGIAVAATLNRAYVNCWVTEAHGSDRNLSTQRVETVVDFGARGYTDCGSIVGGALHRARALVRQRRQRHHPAPPGGGSDLVFLRHLSPPTI